MAIRLSENLRIKRMRERYSLEDVAEIIGVSRQSVAKWENGESLPDIEKCAKLAKLYKVSIDALVNDNLNLEEEEGEDGKYCFGITVIEEGGKITLTPKSMEVFGLSSGDSLLLLCDVKKGMALFKCEK